ncbi:MAG TPA: hypothetical protein VF715_10275 [Thermoleophilaceae bacterium]|jgi:hypothetical protein
MLALLLAASLGVLAIWVIAKVTMRTMKRLGLDLMPTLLWLGLAELTAPPAPPRLRDLAMAPPPSPATRVAR